MSTDRNDLLTKTWDALEQEANDSMIFDESTIKKSMNKNKNKKTGYNSTIWFEVGSLLIGAYFALLLTYQFAVFETLSLILLSIAMILLLIIFPMIRLIILAKVARVSKYQLAIGDVLGKFLKYERTLLKFYRIRAICGLAIIPLSILMVKVYNEFQVLESPVFWTVMTFLGAASVISIYRWVLIPVKERLDKSRKLIEELN